MVNAMKENESSIGILLIIRDLYGRVGKDNIGLEYWLRLRR